MMKSYLVGLKACSLYPIIWESENSLPSCKPRESRVPFALETFLSSKDLWHWFNLTLQSPLIWNEDNLEFSNASLLCLPTHLVFLAQENYFQALEFCISKSLVLLHILVPGTIPGHIPTSFLLALAHVLLLPFLAIAPGHMLFSVAGKQPKCVATWLNQVWHDGLEEQLKTGWTEPLKSLSCSKDMVTLHSCWHWAWGYRKNEQEMDLPKSLAYLYSFFFLILSICYQTKTLLAVSLGQEAAASSLFHLKVGTF